MTLQIPAALSEGPGRGGGGGKGVRGGHKTSLTL